MRSDQEPAQKECISLAYRRLANAMILSTLRQIFKNEEIDGEALEIDFVESQRLRPWCDLAGLEADTVRRAARRLIGEKAP